MSPSFQSYASNLYRVSLIELIDDQAAMLRRSQARPSLIVNPLSGLPYPSAKQNSREQPQARS
jgi:hypothetical protein